MIARLNLEKGESYKTNVKNLQKVRNKQANKQTKNKRRSNKKKIDK